jgi:hypothetical protein
MGLLRSTEPDFLPGTLEMLILQTLSRGSVWKYMPVGVSLKFHSSRANSRSIAQGLTPRSSVESPGTERQVPRIALRPMALVPNALRDAIISASADLEAVRGVQGDQCAVCESWNRLVCKILR